MIRVVFALSLAILCARPVAAADGPLDIYFIDVDGGAATLIVTPSHESILIDSGWPGRDDRDPKRIVHVLKDVARLKEIDFLITTHWHMDHFGGIEGLSKLVPIRQFFDRGFPGIDGPAVDFPDGPKPDDPLGKAYLAATSGRRNRRRVMTKDFILRIGDSVDIEDDLKLEALASGGKVRSKRVSDAVNPLAKDAPADKPVDKSDNARSLAMKFTFRGFTFLDCGDLTWNVEKDLVCPYDHVGKVDLFQVTHHGMDISNNPVFVKTIAPTVAVMDNGPTKGGSPATVKLLKSIPSIEALYQLHANQATGPEDNTDPALIANKSPAGGEFIHVSVAPDGKTYTVQIGADGAKRTFQTRK